jgi:hypothetical protein
MTTLTEFLATADTDNTYDARVPSEWRTADLFVDDAYGVVGAG